MSAKRARVDYEKHIDPEYRRWGKEYPTFPGVAECVRLLRARNVKGAWVDIIVWELANDAADCLPELVAAYRADNNERVRFFVLMAIEDARLPAAIPFLEEVSREDDPRVAAYGARGLSAIDTKESRTALWRLKNSQPPAAS